ncbi:PDDEXK nuclease domain-containing protein [Phocoenobacter atlanticus]|uniref:PDDEXK nuclease domain-containing protein n=1 Tax=Phocoenobacter atlanticus TaxID=3416742 RepID=UPI00274E50EC|nr:PDDEXK nuclease domain-containing protein [Pasteurella atlantica]MDP8101569.1 PDDEXK nuclease domain-containing protein [Pasteurella atlantica]
MTSIQPNYLLEFTEISSMIKSARENVIKAINSELIELYWNIGKYITNKVKQDGWGNKVVQNLADFLKQSELNSKGFSAQNLWRMKQFYETYHKNPKLSLLVREISWTNNILIISQTKSDEEREFYLNLTAKEKYTKKELSRQLASGLFERVLLSDKNISPLAREIYPNINQHIKDYYSLEFLGLQNDYSEFGLKKSIIHNLKDFILEFGKDFLFVGEEFKLQVGSKDYAIDLLFYHRELNCLVALELKVGDFKPEYMGKMDFYLGALDKYVKKPHENPSIGIILCRTKDENIVEISLNRSTSPTIISQYETKLIDKKLLRSKLDELFYNE